jgi:hypothetical protein
MVHSVSLQQRVVLATLGDSVGQRCVLDRSCLYSVNQTMEVVCVDVVLDGHTHSDSHVSFHLGSP